MAEGSADGGRAASADSGFDFDERDRIMSVKLSAATLARLPAGVAAPKYRRSDLSAGIVHIGVGNFHRAHQAVYLDDLFNAGRDHDWAIVGSGVRDPDVAVRAKLEAQDWLTTVVQQEAEATDIRVTGSMIDFVRPYDTGALLSRLSEPSIRIVSLTVTEGGYYISPATQHFDPKHADIVYDAQHGDAPKTAFGLIVAGIKRRRAAGTAPFTVMSCDNIPGNGHVTENAVAGLAELADPELARWIRLHVAFPNSMVDRITPATSDRERTFLRDTYGVEDNWPVFCEEFRQWVVEDRFPGGRPLLETAGVTFTSDVSPYELMKIRILNGGHAAIAYPAGLLDIHFVHEAMADEQIRAFLEKLTKSEIQPVVPPPPNTSLDDYRELIARRFANPKIGDTIQRLCLDGSNRQPKFILPTVADRVKTGASIRGLALVSALWCRYCYGESESGKAIPPNDPNWEQLQEAAKPARDDPRAFLELRHIFGDLAGNPRYVRAFSDALSAVWARGLRSTLADYLSDKP
jgi:mannitol 2-dehydrogenase